MLSDTQSSTDLHAAVDFNFHTKEEAEEVFFELLRDCGVNSSWTWHRAMRELHKYPKYRALKTAHERKESFEKFLRKSRKEEIEHARALESRRRKEFRQMLQESDKLTFISKFSRAESLFALNPAWIVISDNREKRELFDEHISELRRRRREKEKELHNSNKRKFEKLLTQIDDITEDTTWADAQNIIEKLQVFQNDTDLKRMPKIDQLIAFEHHIKSLERKSSEIRRREKDERIKTERHNREQFRSLLMELEKDKKVVTCRTKWKTIYPYLQNDQRYLEMVGQPGSTPMELFRDLIVKLEDEMFEDGRAIQEILKSRKFEMTSETTLDAFREEIFKDSKINTVKQSSIPIVYDILQEKIRKKIRHEKKQEERRIRHLWHGFKHLLKKLDPAVTIESRWEDVEPRISFRSAYLAVDNSEMRLEFFKKYLKRLKQKKRSYHSDDDDELEAITTRSPRRRADSHGQSHLKRRNRHRSLSESSTESQNGRHARSKRQKNDLERENDKHYSDKEEGEASTDEGEIKE